MIAQALRGFCLSERGGFSDEALRVLQPGKPPACSLEPSEPQLGNAGVVGGDARGAGTFGVAAAENRRGPARTSHPRKGGVPPADAPSAGFAAAALRSDAEGAIHRCARVYARRADESSEPARARCRRRDRRAVLQDRSSSAPATPSAIRVCRATGNGTFFDYPGLIPLSQGAVGI